MDGAILTKADPSSVIIEHVVCLDKSGQELLPIFKRSRCLSIGDEFLEGISKKPAGIETPKESITVVTTRLRS